MSERLSRRLRRLMGAERVRAAAGPAVALTVVGGLAWAPLPMAFEHPDGTARLVTYTAAQPVLPVRPTLRPGLPVRPTPPPRPSPPPPPKFPPGFPTPGMHHRHPAQEPTDEPLPAETPTLLPQPPVDPTPTLPPYPTSQLPTPTPQLPQPQLPRQLTQPQLPTAPAVQQPSVQQPNVQQPSVQQPNVQQPNVQQAPVATAPSLLPLPPAAQAPAQVQAPAPMQPPLQATPQLAPLTPQIPTPQIPTPQAPTPQLPTAAPTPQLPTAVPTPPLPTAVPTPGSLPAGPLPGALPPAPVPAPAPGLPGGQPQAAGQSKQLKIWLTGYSWQDNTPPGSAIVSHPILHKDAGGTGTYQDPITVAVPGQGDGIWKAGARFYLPSVRRYVIVEDTGASKPPSGQDGHLDMWIGGQGGTKQQTDQCMNKITGTNVPAIFNPPPNLPVIAGPIWSNGTCNIPSANNPGAGSQGSP